MLIGNRKRARSTRQSRVRRSALCPYPNCKLERSQLTELPPRIHHRILELPEISPELLEDINFPNQESFQTSMQSMKRAIEQQEEEIKRLRKRSFNATTQHNTLSNEEGLYSEEHLSVVRGQNLVELLETGAERFGRLDEEFMHMPHRSPQLVEVEENLNLLTDSKELSEYGMVAHPPIDGPLDGDEYFLVQ